jgi:hypothetical protein
VGVPLGAGVITADTITDEQILDLALSDRNDTDLQDLCDAAMSRVLAERAPDRCRKYRARCAEILNARSTP